MIKKILKRIIYREKYNSETYSRWLRKQGVKIGERVKFYGPQSVLLDLSRPWLIEIGDDVQITAGVTILTHGYDWSVLKGVYGDVLGSAGGVSIGDNVFIGTQSTILKGVHIGNNVIIGANSLVNHDIPDNCVAAGNPAHVIMTLEEYYKKRKDAQYEEAVELVKKYRERYKKEPNDECLREFFWLFANADDPFPKCWKHVMELVGNEDFFYAKMAMQSPHFKNKKSFLDSIR